MLKKPWTSKYKDGSREYLDISQSDGYSHSRIADFVVQMDYDWEPNSDLKRFKHTLLNAPVFESFVEKFLALHAEDGDRDIRSEIEQLVENSDIRSYMYENQPKRKIERLIEELEAELNTLRASLRH